MEKVFDQGYKHYLVEEAGFKYNMLDLQAAIRIHQLKELKNTQLEEKDMEYYLK